VYTYWSHVAVAAVALTADVPSTGTATATAPRPRSVRKIVFAKSMFKDLDLVSVGNDQCELFGC
jgi:hypothetical protein